jgi:hypothetical protein
MFLLFSAFSTEKIGENSSSFGYVLSDSSGEKEAFLQPKARINIKGTSEFGVYNDKIDIRL